MRKDNKCKRGHIVQGSNAILRRDGNTACRECQNLQNRKGYHAQTNPSRQASDRGMAAGKYLRPIS